MIRDERDVQKYVGTIAMYSTNRFGVYVRILDVGRARVRLRFLITPALGNGQKWVEAYELYKLPQDQTTIPIEKQYTPE